jgi:hypothetical protein
MIRRFDRRFKRNKLKNIMIRRIDRRFDRKFKIFMIQRFDDSIVELKETN